MDGGKQAKDIVETPGFRKLIVTHKRTRSEWKMLNEDPNDFEDIREPAIRRRHDKLEQKEKRTKRLTERRKKRARAVQDQEWKKKMEEKEQLDYKKHCHKVSRRHKRGENVHLDLDGGTDETAVSSTATATSSKSSPLVKSADAEKSVDEKEIRYILVNDTVPLYFMKLPMKVMQETDFSLPLSGIEDKKTDETVVDWSDDDETDVDLTG